MKQKKNVKKQAIQHNLVAKHMNTYNKPATHANKKTDYKRSPKHKTRFGDYSFKGSRNNKIVDILCNI